MSASATTSTVRRTRPRKSIPSLLVNTQSYHCPHCEGAIRPDAIFGKTDNTTQPPTRTVHVKCDFCDVIFKGVFAIQADRLEALTPPVIVAALAEVEAVNSRIAQARGDRQL